MGCGCARKMSRNRTNSSKSKTKSSSQVRKRRVSRLVSVPGTTIKKKKVVKKTGR